MTDRAKDYQTLELVGCAASAPSGAWRRAPGRRRVEGLRCAAAARGARSQAPSARLARRQGTFGTVHKVRCRSDGAIYCLKRIHLQAGGGSQGGALTEAKVRFARSARAHLRAPMPTLPRTPSRPLAKTQTCLTH